MAIFVPDVYVSTVGALTGRGVFARRPFKAGETIEFAPIVLFGFPIWKLPEEVRTRLFDWKRLGGSVEAHAMGLGYASLYNHMNPANVRYTANEDRQALQFLAAREIERDEELFINYASDGGGIESEDEQGWFNKMGVKLEHNDS